MLLGGGSSPALPTRRIKEGQRGVRGGDRKIEKTQDRNTLEEAESSDQKTKSLHRETDQTAKGPIKGRLFMRGLECLVQWEYEKYKP